MVVITSGQESQMSYQEKVAFEAFLPLNQKQVQFNISSVVEFQRFLAKNQHTQKIFLRPVDELRFVKKCKNRTFKGNFQCQKSTDFFQKKSFKNINLGDHFW